MKIIFEVTTIKDAKDAIAMLSSMVERSRLESLPAIETHLAPQDGVTVDNLNLPVRTVNCLKAGNIHQLSELIRWTKNDLMKVPNLGRTGLNSIIERLDARGLKLKD